MFCPQCGHTIEQGKSFCLHCGAKLGGQTAPAPVAGPGGLPQGWSPPPPPPPPPGWNAGGGPGTETQSSRTLWIVLAIVGAFIILGGGGAAAWFFLIRDDNGPEVVSTSVTRTTVSGTTGTGGAGTTRPQSTTVPGSGTTVTVPGYDPGSTSTSRATSTSRVTTTTTGSAAYIQAVGVLERALQKADTRIPQLADRINATAPNVPSDVRDELNALWTEVSNARDQLGLLDPPEPWMEADTLIFDADTAMEYRIEMTILGIEAMWDQGTVDAATYYFDEGRAGRDEYRRLFDEYLRAKP